MSSKNSQRIQFDETLHRCQIPPTAPSVTWLEFKMIVLNFTQRRFSTCANIFSEHGLPQDILVHSIRCISLALKHPTDMRHVNGSNLYFVCSSNPTPSTKKRDQTVVSARCCPFYLHFRTRETESGSSTEKSKTPKIWYYDESDDLTSLSIKCQEIKWPEICTKISYLEYYINEWLGTSSIEEYTTSTILDYS